MADLPSRDELFNRVTVALLNSAGTRISPRELQRAGSDVNLIAAAMALLCEEVLTRQGLQVSGMFEDTATGGSLDRVVFDRKGISRIGANPSLISFQLQRPTVAGGAGTVIGGLPGSTPAPTRVQNQNGIVYLLTQNAAFTAVNDPTGLGPITISGQAQLAGLPYEVDINQTWTFIDTPFDPTITCTNAQQSAGASDVEADAKFRQRAKDFFPTIRRGTLPAIQFGLNSTAGVDSSTAFEVINPNTSQPFAFIQGYVIDAIGQGNDTLAARALLSLTDFRAAGIPVSVSSATPSFQAIRIIPTWDATIVNDTVTAANKMKLAIVAALNNLRPGQTLYRSTIRAAALSIPGLILPDLTSLLVPTGDLVTPNNSTVFRTRFELITTV